jgi:branched-chain amino acid transport system ATP-binding protein
MLLELRNVWVRYGPVAAVRNFTMSVDRGDFMTIPGANGAGKTSMLNAISGIVPIDKGEILFEGKRIDGKRLHRVTRKKINKLFPEKIAAMGIIQVPEGRKLFPLMTVRENLQVGAYLQNDRNQQRRSLDRVLALFPGLEGKLKAKARELSSGQQQMVAIGRGLMAHPIVLLLDEPSLGLSPLLRQQLAEKIKEINQEGITVVLVEQNARLGLMLAAHGYVLENGVSILQGKTSELMENEEVKKAYLGV